MLAPDSIERTLTGKAKRVLGWRPRYPTYREGLRALVSAVTSPASASSEAPGMFCAVSRPAASGTSGSASPWITSVGTRTDCSACYVCNSQCGSFGLGWPENRYTKHIRLELAEPIVLDRTTVNL